MATDAAPSRPSRPLLTLGRVDLLRIQVGYRAGPESPAYLQFLLDLPVSEEPGVRDLTDQDRLLAALEPVLFVGDDKPRHYSLHQHRWHTSWGANPGALELGLLVTTGTDSAALTRAAFDVVTRAFRRLLHDAGPPAPGAVSRDAALLAARRGAATAYGLDPDGLLLSAEQHNPGEESWTVELRAAGGDAYDVVVGFVDGYAGAVSVRHQGRAEVYDAVGAE